MTMHIGQAARRENARRHLAGRGRFVSDLALPRMLHAVFVRSPMARGRIFEIDTSEASACPGVVRIFTAAELNARCTPWIGTLGHFAGMQSPPMNILAEDEVLWTGHPVAMVLARSRAEAPARECRT